MNGSLKVGKVLGIDLEIHFSWVIIFVFFSYALSEQYQMISPERESLWYWIAGIFTTIIIFLSVFLHELAHSLVAIKEGISIRRITLFIFGGVAQMEEEPSSSSSELKISVAGPLTSLGLAIFFGILAFFTNTITEGLPFWVVFFLFYVNLAMAIFNMIPAFPLDGGRILRASIWKYSHNLLSSTRVAVSVGTFFAFLAIAYGFYTILVVGNIWGLWFVFLGWMLYQAGQASFSQLLFNQAFSGVNISEIMTTNPYIVPPDMTILEVANKFYQHKVGAFPVVYGSTLHGIVTLNQIKDAPREKWETLPVSYIMTPLKNCVTVSPQEEAVKVMTKMAVENLGRVLVVEHGELVGIISRTDMMRLLKMNMILGSERVR